MADTLKRLAGPVVGTGADAAIYTAPTAGAALRGIRVVNTTTTEQTFHLSIGADAAGTRLNSATPVAPGEPYDWSGLIVLGNSESLHWVGPATLTITISGVEQ